MPDGPIITSKSRKLLRQFDARLREYQEREAAIRTFYATMRRARREERLQWDHTRWDR